MVQAYRLLAHGMYKLGWDYPLHLGVTEAGEGEDGRMKSSIGIGALLLDGLGDTIRVSLTEASHLEMEPCTRLRDVGHKAAEEKWGVEKFEEKGRDFKDFARRASDLPVQKEDDAIDLRNILHRDGSVLSAVTPAHLASEDPFYRDLGAKLAVGMPLRDVATSDSILLTEVPEPSDEKAMRSIRRLQEIGVGVVADAAALAERPVDNPSLSSRRRARRRRLCPTAPRASPSSSTAPRPRRKSRRRSAWIPSWPSSSARRASPASTRLAACSRTSSPPVLPCR